MPNRVSPLSQAEQVMLHSLLLDGPLLEGEPPLWQVSGKWVRSQSHIAEALSACESLLGKGLVEAGPTADRVRQDDLRLYTLTQQGRMLVEQPHQALAAEVKARSAGAGQPPRFWEKLFGHLAAPFQH